MSEFILTPSLEELTQAKVERLQLKQDIRLQIEDQHLDILHENNFELRLAEPLQTFAGSTINVRTPLVRDIRNINTWVQPYLQNPKKQVLYLSEANQVSQVEFTNNNWQPSAYSHSNVADVKRGKLTSIAHPDSFQGGGHANNATTSLEFLTAPLTQDLDELAVVFNYLYSYAASYEFQVNAPSNFCRQEVRLTLNVYEVDVNGATTIRPSFPKGEKLADFELRLIVPPGNYPASDSTVIVPQHKLQYFTIPQAKQNKRYRIVFDLYAYGWANHARLATEGNFSLIPFA